MGVTKIALVVEYEGTRFHGFQLQPESPTVQEVLEEAVYHFTGERTRVDCASRTDAGVHAEAQVASVRTGSAHRPETWVKALNHYLPEDVAVKAAFVVPSGFNVRSRAVGRRYRYLILNKGARSALLRGRAFWVPKRLDLEVMNEAAARLLGKRDFAPFASAAMKKGLNTVRVLRQAEFHRDGDLVIFEVEGGSFLPQQVRRMAGALVQVGLGRSTLAQFWAQANSGTLGAAGPTLPPHGLTLVEVIYPEFPPQAATEKAINHEHGDEDVYTKGERDPAELARH